MSTSSNVVAALDDAREHALPGRAAVAINEVVRRLRDLVLKGDGDDRPVGRTAAAGNVVGLPDPDRAARRVLARAGRR
jgi:hypothetical protein